MSKYFVPMTMNDRDADIVAKMFMTMRELRLASADDIANIISIMLFVSTQKHIMQLESDYDDHH